MAEMDQMTRMTKNFLRKPAIARCVACLLLGLVLAPGSGAWAADAWLQEGPEFLRVDEAFVFLEFLQAWNTRIVLGRAPGFVTLEQQRASFRGRAASTNLPGELLGGRQMAIDYLGAHFGQRGGRHTQRIESQADEQFGKHRIARHLATD